MISCRQKGDAWNVRINAGDGKGTQEFSGLSISLALFVVLIFCEKPCYLFRPLIYIRTTISYLILENRMGIFVRNYARETAAVEAQCAVMQQWNCILGSFFEIWSFSSTFFAFSGLLCFLPLKNALHHATIFRSTRIKTGKSHCENSSWYSDFQRRINSAVQRWENFMSQANSLHYHGWLFGIIHVLYNSIILLFRD